MTYETAIQLAHQRMREMGKEHEHYHIEPISIVGTAQERKNGEIITKAYNEIFFLVNYEVYYGIEIISDTGYFNSDDYTENTRQEFTGLIRILLTSKTLRSIDFVKVTLH